MQFFLLFLFYVLSACSAHQSAEKETLNVVNVTEVAQDIRLPRNLFKELEAELNEEFSGTATIFTYIPLQVQFNEADGQKVLKDTPLNFHFEKGGGQIDLKEVVSGTGSFYLNFPPDQFSNTSELVHLYYISQAPIKLIGDDQFGLGCGKWIDLKKSFKKLQNGTFLKLNTTQQRHLHVLAGHYVFVFKQLNQIMLTQMSITDTRYPNELCSVGEIK